MSNTSSLGVGQVLPLTHFRAHTGYEFIAQLILHDEKRTATILAVKTKYYALAAASALFKYLETTYSLAFPPRSLRIEYAPLEGTCMIDVDTAVNLELVANVSRRPLHPRLDEAELTDLDYATAAQQELEAAPVGPDEQVLHAHGYEAGELMSLTLFGTGSRPPSQLRTNLLSPLTDVTVIDSRLDAVEELVNSEERLSAVRKALERLKSLDSDKLVGQLVTPMARPKVSSTNLVSSNSVDPAKTAEAKIGRLLSLRTLLVALPALRAAVHNMDAPLLGTIGRILQDERAEEMVKKIAEVSNEEALAGVGGNKGKGALAGRNGRIYAVRAERKLLYVLSVVCPLDELGS